MQQPEVCYRVDEKIFNSIDEANKFCEEKNSEQRIFEENVKYIEAFSSKTTRN